jgi:RNA polymerase sigma-70 factor, ECF subfamily
MSQGSEPPGHLSAEALFRIHGSFVARFLSQLGVPRGELDDVVQEVFLVVHARGGYTPGPAKPTSYLGGIAVLAAHAARRRAATGRARHAELPGEQGSDGLPGDGPAPDARLEADEQALRVRRALATLPEDLRAVLLLVELEGESCGSVAASMGCAVGTIYWRLHTAKKRFRQALAQGDATITADAALAAEALAGRARDGWKT